MTCEEAVEVLVLEAEEEAVDRDAGVRDEDVEPAVPLGDVVDRGLGGLRVGDVEARDLGLAALRDDRRRRPRCAAASPFT